MLPKFLFAAGLVFSVTVANAHAYSENFTLTNKEVHVFKDEDYLNSDRYAPGYEIREAPLKNLDSGQYRDVHFVVVFAVDGAGRIESRKTPGEPKTRYNAPELYEGGARVFKWDDQVCFSHDGKKTPLNLEIATKIFGESRKHENSSTVFYTFDPSTVALPDGEQQLYHIDMKFADTGVIKSYRVRGIGVTKPRWLSS